MNRWAALLFAMCCVANVAATESIVLNVASFPDFHRGVEIAAERFKQKYPNVQIRLSKLAYHDHHTAMTTSLASGANVPDLLAVEMAYIGRFADSAGLEDLSAGPYSAKFDLTKLPKFAIAAARSSEGRLSALPVDVGPGTMFYRTDLLEKANVTVEDLTRSWESYVESGKKIRAATGAYLLPNVTDIKDIIIRADLQDGEGIYFDQSGKSLVQTRRFERAFSVAKAARDAALDARVQQWTNEWSEGFRRGRITTQMLGAWLGGHLQKWIAPSAAGQWRASHLPEGAFAPYGGAFYAIPKKARQKQYAAEFLHFLVFDREQQLLAFSKVDAFPALLDAHDDPMVDAPIEYFAGQKARQLWRESTRKIPAINVDRYDEVAREIVNAELDKVLQGTKTIATALVDADKSIARRIRRYR